MLQCDKIDIDINKIYLQMSNKSGREPNNSKTSRRTKLTDGKYEYKYKPIALDVVTLQGLFDSKNARLTSGSGSRNSSNNKLDFTINNSVCKVKEYKYSIKKSTSEKYHSGFIVRINEFTPKGLINYVKSIGVANIDNGDKELLRKYVTPLLFDSDGNLNEGITPLELHRAIYENNLRIIMSSGGISSLQGKITEIMIPGLCKPCSTHLFDMPAYKDLKDKLDFIKIDVTYMKNKCDDLSVLLANKGNEPKKLPKSNYKSDILFTDNNRYIDKNMQKYIITDKVIADGVEYIIVGHPNWFDMVDTIHNIESNTRLYESVKEKIKRENLGEYVRAFNELVKEESFSKSPKDKAFWKDYIEITGENPYITETPDNKEIYKLLSFATAFDIKYFKLLFQLMNGKMEGRLGEGMKGLMEIIDYVNARTRANVLENIGFPCVNIKYQFQVFHKLSGKFVPSFISVCDVRTSQLPIIDRINELIETRITPIFGINPTKRFFSYIRMGDIFTVNAEYVGTNSNKFEYNYIYSSLIQLSVFRKYVECELYLNNEAEIPAYRYRNYKFHKYSGDNIIKINEFLPQFDIEKLKQPQYNRKEIRDELGKLVVTPEDLQNATSPTNIDQYFYTIDKIEDNNKDASSGSLNNTMANSSDKSAPKDIYVLSVLKLQSDSYAVTMRIGDRQYYCELSPNMIPTEIIAKLQEIINPVSHSKGTSFNTMRSRNRTLGNWRNRNSIPNTKKNNNRVNSAKTINKTTYFNTSYMQISVICDALFNEYQPYRLSYFTEITFDTVNRFLVPYYDTGNDYSSLGLTTVDSKNVTSRPYMSLQKTSELLKTLDINSIEYTIIRLKFIARTVIDFYLAGIKKLKLLLQTNKITLGKQEEISRDDKLMYSDDKLISAVRVTQNMSIKLGKEHSSVFDSIYKENDKNINFIDKNCIFLFNNNFCELNLNKDENFNDKIIDLLNDNQYNNYLYDYSSLTQKYYNSLINIINKSSLSNYHKSYSELKDIICIKFHNYNSCMFKVLHMHMGPESNYYNYEKFNKHSYVRETKNLLISHTLFGLSNPTFNFDNIYYSRFGEQFIYI